MNNYINSFLLFIAFVVLFTSCSIFEPTKETTLENIVESFRNDFKNGKISYSKIVDSNIDSILVDSENLKLRIYFNKQFASIPFRSKLVDSIYSETQKYFTPLFSNENIQIISTGFNIRDLIPNYFRNGINMDSNRIPTKSIKSKPIVYNMSKNRKPKGGLYNNNIALWHSHGWYYHHNLDRWMWQRARLFQTVEDLGPMTFTLPFILPMLENAGANVFLPRERDFQLNEVIIDNEDREYCSFDNNRKWELDSSKGFNHFGISMEANYNPFENGTNHFVNVTEDISKNEMNRHS